MVDNIVDLVVVVLQRELNPYNNSNEQSINKQCQQCNKQTTLRSYGATTHPN
jgi:hypothetical protein